MADGGERCGSEPLYLDPTAEFTEVPNAGHFITLEQPDVLAELLTSLA